MGQNKNSSFVGLCAKAIQRSTAECLLRDLLPLSSRREEYTEQPRDMLAQWSSFALLALLPDIFLQILFQYFGEMPYYERKDKKRTEEN